MKKFNIEEKLPCLQEKYPRSEQIKKTLVDLICKECQYDPQQRKTNVKAFMSKWNLYDDTIEELIVWIKNLIETELCIKSISAPNKSNLFKLVDCWGIVYIEGDYTQNHIHESSYSFVYYVHISDNPSPLIFTTSNEKFEPKEGNVIIFPGKIWHYVPVNKSDTRVVLAGNFNNI